MSKNDMLKGSMVRSLLFLTRSGKKYDKAVAQVTLRYLIRRGTLPRPNAYWYCCIEISRHNCYSSHVPK